MNQKLQNKRIAMIIASQEFRDEECFETKAICIAPVILAHTGVLKDKKAMFRVIF